MIFQKESLVRMLDRLELGGSAIVCEVQGTVKEQVQRLREKFDPVLANDIPVEITVAGSSGIGSITFGQDGAAILDELARIAKQLKPFEARLGSVTRFPGTDIFVFEVLPREPFETIYHWLLGSSIAFASSINPFFPHCSLHIWGKVEPEQEAEMMRQRITGSFWVDSFAVYQRIDDKAVGLVDRFRFKP